MNLFLNSSGRKHAKNKGVKTLIVLYENTTKTHLSLSRYKFLLYVVRKLFETLKMAELTWIGIEKSIISMF